MHTTPDRVRAALRLAAALLLALGQPSLPAREASPATVLPAPDAPPEAVPGSYDRSVRLVAQDGGGRPNDHPAALGPSELRAVLAALAVFGAPAFLGLGGEPIPVFTEDEARALAQGLASGFAQAKPDQDIAMIAERLRDAFFFAKEPIAVGGRVFYVDRRLHIIFGDLHQPAGRPIRGDSGNSAHLAERRLHPVRIGSRAGDIAHQWRFAPLEGVSLHAGPGTTRADWLEIHIPIAIAALRHRSIAADPPRPEPGAPTPEGGGLDHERRLQRAEAARVRRSLPDGGTAVSAALRRRLATLEELKNKRLITPEEYDERRRWMRLGLP